MKRRAQPVWYEGARTGTIMGHPVKIDGPQSPSTTKKPARGHIEIDGNVIHYEIGPNGVHSHSFMHANFATPWELAEALVRDFGMLAVRGGRSGSKPHQHGAPVRRGSQRARKAK